MIGPSGSADVVVPDLAEPIEMWRCWVIGGTSDVPILYSPTRSTVWPPPAGWDSSVIRGEQRDYITARCIRRGVDGSPSEPCDQVPSPVKDGHMGVGCGIYGYKTIGDLAWDWPFPGFSRYNSLLRWEGLRIPVWGKALGWGRVFEHEHGYRCEFAKVHSLVLAYGDADPHRRVIADVAAQYGVPLEALSEEDREGIESYFYEREEAEYLSVSGAVGSLRRSLVDSMAACARTMKQMVAAMKDVASVLESFGNTPTEEGDEDG